MALSDELERKIGQRTSKGTKITSELVGRVRADEAGLVEIRRDNTRALAEHIGDAILTALEEIGIDAERICSESAPVDTGRLSASVTHALDPSEPAVYVGTNVFYGKFVHEGVHGKPGNPFLRKPVANNRERFKAILKKHLGNV